MSTPTYLPALGRLLIALIFVLSGLSKIAAPANTIAYIQSAGAPFAPAAFGIAAVVEVIGGLALLVGFQTRLVAAILATFTLAAAVLFHNNLADQNQMIHFRAMRLAKSSRSSSFRDDAISPLAMLPVFASMTFSQTFSFFTVLTR